MSECFFAATDPTGSDHTKDLQLAAGGAEAKRAWPGLFQNDTYYCDPCRRGRRSMIVPRSAGYYALEGKPLPTSKDLDDSGSDNR
jgi:hypothetical protein